MALILFPAWVTQQWRWEPISCPWPWNLLWSTCVWEKCVKFGLRLSTAFRPRHCADAAYEHSQGSCPRRTRWRGDIDFCPLHQEVFQNRCGKCKNWSSWHSLYVFLDLLGLAKPSRLALSCQAKKDLLNFRKAKQEVQRLNWIVVAGNGLKVKAITI